VKEFVLGRAASTPSCELAVFMIDYGEGNLTSFSEISGALPSRSLRGRAAQHSVCFLTESGYEACQPENGDDDDRVVSLNAQSNPTLIYLNAAW